MKRLDVAVLGAGPAGLFAALAALNNGCRVTIYSKEWQRPGPEAAGVFVLHDSMDLPLESFVVREIAVGGTAADYAKKVYGSETVPTSFRPGNGTAYYYSGKQAIQFAWDIVSISAEYRKKEIAGADLSLLAGQHQLVVSTVPLPILMPSRVWPYAEAFVKQSKAPLEESFILQHANPSVPFYRCSAVEGTFTMEFPPKYDDDPGLRKVRKVMPHDNAQFLEHIRGALPNVVYTGRFGAWDKGKLSHHAFDDTVEAIHAV